MTILKIKFLSDSSFPLDIIFLYWQVNEASEPLNNESLFKICIYTYMAKVQWSMRVHPLRRCSHVNDGSSTFS